MNTKEIDRLTSILTMSRRGRSRYTSNPILDYSRPTGNKGLLILEAGGEHSISPAFDPNPYGGMLDIHG